MMFIEGIEVPSSCVKTGARTECEACAKRLTRGAHGSVTWRVMPCIA